MSVRRKNSRFKDNVASFRPSRDGKQGATSLLNTPLLPPSVPPLSFQPEISLRTHEEGSTPALGWEQAQPTGSHISKVAASLDEATASHHDSFSTGGWAGLRKFFNVLEQGTSVFGLLRTVVDELVGCVEIYERVANGCDEFKALQDELDGIFNALTQHFSRDVPPMITASIESLCKYILKELVYVKGKQNRDTTKRYLETGEEEASVLACYRRIHGHLQRLSLNANLSMWNIVDEQATDARLDRLCPSLSACYNSRQATELKRGSCTPGTRVDVLGGMYSWVHNRSPGSVYWLNGMAGTGKTTIAYSLCIELEASYNLGASFFCSRSLPECRDANLIVPSIAYQLAHFSRPFRWALSRVLEKERNVHTQLLHIQFERLIVRPLVEVRDTLPKDLVVVIDALDECENKNSTRQILDALLTKTSDLPIKVFMASRPEPEIRDQMKKRDGSQTISRLVLHELDKGMVQGDVEMYLRAALEPIKPSESEIQELVRRAGILFIYAATVVRYISHDNFGKNPRNRLKNVLNVSSAGGNNPYKDIDELYTLILVAAIDDPELDDVEREDTKQVLCTVICAQEPLTISALSGLLNLQDTERVHAALRPLWSVLHIVESNELVTTLHTSFLDYMFDPERSKRYCCDPTAQDHTLVRCCFDCIRSANPQFNICGLESSYIPDEKVENLSERVEKAISPELYYACRYWTTHLERVKPLSDVIERLEEFLSARLLLWMEMMNLKKCIHTGVGMIKQVEDWCMRQVCPEELIQLTRDAWRFIAAFTSCAVSQSTPHIYVSMLALWPKTCPIWKCYAKRTQVPMIPQGPAVSRRQVDLLAVWPVNGPVTLVVWSPDGARIAFVTEGRLFLHDPLTGQLVLGPLNQTTHSIQSIWFSPDSALIVSGSDDGVIRIWDAKCGNVIGPLKGHTSSVYSVAFSPDGTRIVSGSKDNTIRLWDAQSRKSVLHPIAGHKDTVTSVAFSPDGTRIISGSYDRTICMWDARSGQLVLGRPAFEGHIDAVTSVAFSPDGSCIASGSSDKTIRIWDAQNGRIVSHLHGEHHDGPVTSVAFSRDSTRIVSGSSDKTIRMWDAQNGQMVLGPLKGHTKSVTSVAFSPDGTRIVSVSSDGTVRMWDARNTPSVIHADPLEGHTSFVASVAFSPDGTRIASGSYNNTVHMWDARSGQRMLGPLEGHMGWVTSVAFSPDGSRIISGSFDNTIQTWDAQSGQRILGSLKEYTSLITSVAFSPDGTRTVSGSGDNSICIWDTQSRQMILGPLKGHNSWVTSVAFSPNGTRIISGSWDNTVRMWDAQSGQLVLGPFTGHAGPVKSVTFSPDSSRIATGSDDYTIRVWDAQNGKMVLDPFKGHTNTVTSVAFSPDGSYIASGSSDMTICIWDAQNGRMVTYPLKGHNSLVASIAFSPDGTRIVSGSGDNTICMWDARVRQTVTLSSNPRPDVHTSWKTRTDGWVLDGEDESKLLVWIPPDLCPALLPPRCILRISTTEHIGLNFITARVGESWSECYQPV